MMESTNRDARPFPAGCASAAGTLRRNGGRIRQRLLFVFLFFFLFVLFLNLAVFLRLFVLFLFFFLVFVQIFGDGIELDGVRLEHFELHFALRTTQNLAFFYFVFVHVNFRGTIRAANHGCVLLESFLRVPA
jgi:hypothetical protein